MYVAEFRRAADAGRGQGGFGHATEGGRRVSARSGPHLIPIPPRRGARRTGWRGRRKGDGLASAPIQSQSQSPSPSPPAGFHTHQSHGHLASRAGRPRRCVCVVQAPGLDEVTHSRASGSEAGENPDSAAAIGRRISTGGCGPRALIPPPSDARILLDHLEARRAEQGHAARETRQQSTSLSANSVAKPQKPYIAIPSPYWH